MIIGKENSFRLRLVNKNNLFILPFSLADRVKEKNSNLYRLVDLKTWHERLGHTTPSTIKEMVKLKIIDSVTGNDSFQCQICPKGKLSKHPYRMSDKHYHVGNVLCMDLLSFNNTVSYGGTSCALLITDAASKFSRAYTLVNKSDVFECLKSFIPWFERQSGVNIKAFRCDNGGEFVNRKATELMKEKGIVLQLTVAYNPQQNGRAEVMNRHYSEMVRSMLVNAGLPNEFWAEALMHATFIKNRTIRKDQKESPVKMCFGIEENLSRIKVFGCKVEYLIPKEKRNKLEEKTRTGLYLGTSDSCYPDYSNSTKHAYRLFDLESCEVVYARDATFFENVFPFDSDTLLSLSCDEISTLANLSYTYEQVMNSEERGSWEKAIKDELKSLEDNGTWDIVEEDKTQRLVEMKWVLNKKFKADGSFDKYKARLVARGFTRTHGIDYLDSYCPTPKPSIISVVNESIGK
jgi:hypothetical protein